MKFIHTYAEKSLLGHIKSIYYCCEDGSDILAQRNNRGESLIHIAIKKNDVDMFNWLMSTGVNHIELTDSCGNTPLISAAIYNRTQMIIDLLNAGGNVNAYNNHGNTVLHYATNHENEILIRLIFENVTPVHKIFNKYGFCARDLASGYLKQLFSEIEKYSSESHPKFEESVFAGEKNEFRFDADGPPAQNFQFLECIGSNDYSSNFKAVYNGTTFMVKMSYRQDLPKLALENLKQELIFLRRNWHVLSSPIVLACFEKPIIYIATYYRPLGNLEKYINEKEADARKDLAIAYQISSVMEYFSSRDKPIHHTNLTCRKVLFVTEDFIEVAGFGAGSMPFSNRGPCSNLIKIKEPEVVSPEVLASGCYKDPRSNSIYSFGILLHKLLTRQQPYQDMNPMKLGLELVKGDVPLQGSHLLSPGMCKLIQLCLDRDPKKRPGFNKIKSLIMNEIGETFKTGDPIFALIKLVNRVSE